MSEVNVTNVIQTNPLDLALWISTEILSVKIPSYGSNSTYNVQGDVMPLLPNVANKISLITELYIIVVGATPTATAVRTNEDKEGSKILSENMGRKKDILYRTLQTLESTRETLSRMMTGLNEINRVNGR